MINIDTLFLRRMSYNPDSTLGTLTLGDIKLLTLELPDKDNLPNVSCIPEGRYSWFKRVSPSRKKEIIELADVPGRTFIQIHEGNFTHQIAGCILPGLGLRDINKDNTFDVTHSRQAFELLMTQTAETGTLVVYSGTKPKQKGDSWL